MPDCQKTAQTENSVSKRQRDYLSTSNISPEATDSLGCSWTAVECGNGWERMQGYNSENKREYLYIVCAIVYFKDNSR